MCNGPRIETRHLPQHILMNGNASIRLSPRPESEMQIILQTLQRNHGNRSRSAADLGMHRTTLWRKLKSYGAVV